MTVGRAVGGRLAAIVAAAVLPATLTTACHHSDSSASVARRAKAEAAGPARALGMTVWFAGREDGEVGVYLRPASAWTADDYIGHLAGTAQVALDLLRAHPGDGDVEVCADATYAVHDARHPFVPATRVTLRAALLGRLPARFASAADVLRASADHTVELIVDPSFVTSPAYRAAVAATVNPAPAPPQP